MTTDPAPHPGPRATGTVVWRPTAFAPPASERALATLGALGLNAFLAAQFLSLTRVFFIRDAGAGLATAATQAGIASVALLVPVLLVYGREGGSVFGTLTRAARLWASALLGLAALLFLYGWLGNNYVLGAVAQDLCPYLVIVAAVVLGSSRRVWKDVNPAMVGLFLAGMVLSAIGMRGPAVVAYRMQGALAFWPLLFLTARRRRPLTQLLVFAGVSLVFVQQILFHERSSSVRVLAYVAVFLVVLPRLIRGEDAPKGRWPLAAFVATGAAAVMVAFGAAPWLSKAQVAAELRRPSGDAYRGSDADLPASENERLSEAGMFFRDLEPKDIVFGRGFGGYFVPHTPGWGERLDDVNVVGRRQLRVGGLMPILKGGVALALVYYAGVAYALWRGRRALHEPLGAAAFFVVLVQTAFLLQEGWFTMSVSFDLIAVGLSMGYLLSRERDRGPDRRARVILVGRWPRGVAA